MKPPPSARSGDQEDANGVGVPYARPTPKVSRLKPGKVLSAREREAFLASRPDLRPKS